MAKSSLPVLGVNIDHVATLRQLRGTKYPDILQAAEAAIRGGAGQITVHLREDRRHIQDRDVLLLRKTILVPLNFEMAATPAMVKFAKKIRPMRVCIVPEKRQEKTTEGGLAVQKNSKTLKKIIADLSKSKIKVSLFIEPDLKVVKLSKELGAVAVEFHTGSFCLKPTRSELKRIEQAGRLARKLGLEVHAGHGIDYENVRPLVALRDEEGHALIEEFNIGHSMICRSVFVGLETATREMGSQIWAP